MTASLLVPFILLVQSKRLLELTNLNGNGKDGPGSTSGYSDTLKGLVTLKTTIFDDLYIERPHGERITNHPRPWNFFDLPTVKKIVVRSGIQVLRIPATGTWKVTVYQCF